MEITRDHVRRAERIEADAARAFVSGDVDALSVAVEDARALARLLGLPDPSGQESGGEGGRAEV